MTQRPALVLASNSPRRRQLLALGDWSFRVSAPNLDERPYEGESPSAYVQRLAQAKAGTASANAMPDEVVVAADTTVVDAGRIIGKPADAGEAAAILRKLRGHSHQVYTAIAAVRVADGRTVSDLCVTDVPMREYTEAEIQAYVAGGDPLDKAGAYSIQDARFHPVDGLRGCFASVMGLPLCHLVRVMREFDGSARVEIPSRCQAALRYDCPVSDSILRGEQVG